MDQPDLSGYTLDFSEFHDLMHQPFTAACREMPGGSRRHLSLWWEFVGRSYIARRTWCRINWHHWCDAWSQQLGDCWVCEHCDRFREK